jgi:Predicted ATPase of the ABC class
MPCCLHIAHYYIFSFTDIPALWTAEILCRILPDLVTCSLIYSSLNSKDLHEFVECIEDQDHLRTQITQAGTILVLFHFSNDQRGLFEKPWHGGCSDAFEGL